MNNMLYECDIQRVENRNAGTAGATVKGDLIDMQGYEEVTFVVAFQTVVNGAVVTFKIAQGDENDTAEMVVSDAALAAVTSDGTEVALSNKQLAIDIQRPTKRYLEPQVVVATQNAPIDHITAFKYRPSVKPIAAQNATVHASGTFLNPEAA